MNKRMGMGQNGKLKADYGQDKTANPGSEEKRELTRRQGSAKKIRHGKEQ
jgi:hypothetical protein